jgi:hypothetical protein
MDAPRRDLFDPDRLRETWSRGAGTQAGEATGAPAERPGAPALELLERLRAAVFRELGKAAEPLGPLFERARGLLEEQAGRGDPALPLEGKAREENATALGLVLDDVEDLLEALRLGAPPPGEESGPEDDGAAPREARALAPGLPEPAEISKVPLALPEARPIGLPEAGAERLFRPS